MNALPMLLYVDDEQINLQLFKINFRKQFEVLTAVDGAQALELMRNTPGICAVVSDLRMPGMSGLEFIEAARVDYPDLPYYLLTGFDISPDIDRALQQNLIRRFFRKPFNPQELARELQLAI